MFKLTRQWQMGEFKGEDTGSPIAVTSLSTQSALNRVQLGGSASKHYDRDIPIDAQVQARPLVFEQAGQPVALDIRLQMGRYWLKLIKNTGDFARQYVQAYPIDSMDETNPRHARVSAHPRSMQSFAAVQSSGHQVAGESFTQIRAMDGWKLHQHLSLGRHVADGITQDATMRERLNQQAVKFLAWFERQYYGGTQAQQDAWSAQHLEYQFSYGAPSAATADQDHVFRAKNFADGRIDWYHTDLATRASLGDGSDSTEALRPTTRVDHHLPMPLSFPGMPDARWWAFEDGRTNLGSMQLGTTDLGRMLYMEFILNYANDWYMLPLSLPTGSFVELHGLMVRNVFNERFWVQPTGSGLDDDASRWTLMTQSVEGFDRQVAHTGLFVAPITPKIQQGKPLNEVSLMRDEMANLVWGIEQTILLPDGTSYNGAEAARQLHRYFQQQADASGSSSSSGSAVLSSSAGAPVAQSAPVRYDVMSSVAEHWIPFIAARQPGSNRQTLLQRGSMLRYLDGLPAGMRITPRTHILRQGLDASPAQAYFIAEEEITQTGIQVTQSYRRARGRYGKTYVWLGMTKQAARAHGQSELSFDRLLNSS